MVVRPFAKQSKFGLRLNAGQTDMAENVKAGDVRPLDQHRRYGSAQASPLLCAALTEPTSS